eukprot:jgi/Tetstr1/464471/TSEL_009229.t1
MAKGSKPSKDGAGEGDDSFDEQAGPKRGRNKGRRGRRDAECSPGGDSDGDAGDGGARSDLCACCGQHTHAHAKGCTVARKKQTAKCYLCGARGHLRSECPNPSAGGRGGKGRSDRRRKARPRDGVEDGAEPRNPADAREVLAEINHPYLDPCFRLHACQARAGLFGPPGELFDAAGVPPECEGVVDLFVDPASFDPASPRYRCWEVLLADERVWGAFGCEPREVGALAGTVDRLEEWVAACPPGKVVAILGGLDFSGECGADEREAQLAVFAKLLRLALKLELPLMLTITDAGREAAAALVAADLPPSWPLHLVHFTGDMDHLVLRLLPALPNLYVGFDGRLTHAKAEATRNLLFDVPIERIMLQTGAPSYIPANLPNATAAAYAHPGMLPAIAKRAAELKGVDVMELMEVVRGNVRSVYGI